MKKQSYFIIVLSIILITSLSSCSLFGTEDTTETEPTATAIPDQQVVVDDPAEPTQERPPLGDQQPIGQGPGQQQGNGCTDSLAATSNMTNWYLYQPNMAIELVWTLENTGTCTWDSGYSLEFIDGDLEPTVTSSPVSGSVAPGSSISFMLYLTTPAADGNYASIWKMQNGDGVRFGQSGSDKPLKMALRVLSSNNQSPTPTPEPTSQAPEPQKEYTLEEDQCYDFNGGNVVDCADSSADIRYSYNDFLGGQFFPQSDIDFAGPFSGEPDKAICEGGTYVPIPITLTAGKWICVKLNTVMTTTYGAVYFEEYDQTGIVFEENMFSPDTNLVVVTPIVNPFILVEGEQLTILTDQCFDAQQGVIMDNCSGIFGGFDYHTVEIKSVDFIAMAFKDTYVSGAMSDEPSKEDCMNVTYTYEKKVWQISDTSYYCYQFVPGTLAYYGWVRPTHHNSSGMTFDFRTWDSQP